MAPPPKAGVRALTDEERATLTRVSKAGSARADRVRRATALLAVAQGQPCARAARQAGCRSGTAIADLVGRCNRRGLAALGLAPGRGRKVTYDTAARARIVATAQRARRCRVRPRPRCAPPLRGWGAPQADVSKPYRAR